MYQSALLFVFTAALLFLLPAGAFAQVGSYGAGRDTSFSLTLTPPLFELSVGPGERWSSALKVVNTNPYDVTLYATVMDFKANGENGRGTFAAAEDAEGAFSFARSVEIFDGPIVVGSGESGEIPFTVAIPDDAEPGGHYAAILVGNKPAGGLAGGSIVNVSSFVTSLLFIKIKGDVVEEGRIREFSSEKMLFQKPEARFTLRFENTGNVHLRPRGNIIIQNMWGKKRGEVAVGKSGNFGNVLPQSTRKFEFVWSGENNFFEVGRYTAIATITYGGEGKKNTVGETSFWIVPVVPVAWTFGGFAAFVLLLIFLMRRYVRRALAREAAFLGLSPRDAEGRSPALPPDAGRSIPEPRLTRPEPRHSLRTLARPLEESVVDLRSVNWRRNEIAAGAPPEGREPAEALTPRQFAGKYALFFAFIAVLLIGGVGFWLYFSEVLLPKREFRVEILEDFSL